MKMTQEQRISEMESLLREVIEHRYICCGTLAPLAEWDDLIRRIKVVLNGNSNT